MRRSTVPRPRSGWSSRFVAAALLGAAACAPAPPAVIAPALPREEPAVRVGLAVDTTTIEIGATTEFEVRDPVDDRVLLRLAPGESVTIEAGDGELRVANGGESVTANGLVGVHPAVGGFLYIGDRLYRGSAVLQATSPGRMTVVNEVAMEEYLLGVVPHEIGRVGPELLEAAKAQAVAARTYAIRYLGRREALGFDVFATVEDQVYGGAQGEHDPVSRAVLETRGEVLLHGGMPIEAYYHSTCSGRTAAIEEVWPGEEPRPYLISIIDVDPETGEAYDVTSSRFRWTERWSADELGEIFAGTLADSLPPAVGGVGEIVDLEIIERTASNRIRTMRITTDSATFHVGGDRIRWVFLTPAGNILNSSNFEVRIERDAAGEPTEIVAEGMGWGHGIGMCQVGAMGRARSGQEYRRILEAYYPGTSVLRLY